MTIAAFLSEDAIKLLCSFPEDRPYEIKKKKEHAMLVNFLEKKISLKVYQFAFNISIKEQNNQKINICQMVGERYD